MTEAIKFGEKVSSNLERTEFEEKSVSVVVGFVFSGGATSRGFEAVVYASKESSEESHQGEGCPAGIPNVGVRTQVGFDFVRTS